MVGINITWNVISTEAEEKLREMMNKYSAIEQATTSEEFFFKKFNVSIKKYKDKLVVQGQENTNSLRLIQEIDELSCLELDKKNLQKFLQHFPRTHNAILCMNCKKTTTLITGKIKGLDIVFTKECGCIEKMKPPLLMLVKRILPDFNILIGNHLSRFIEWGYFNDFEVVIPDFVMNCLDVLGKRRKSGIFKELGKLREFKKDGKIEIFNFKDGFNVPDSRKKFEKEEDNIILKIANLTNSILITGDRNLKDKAILENRPTIYIDPQELKKTKITQKVRS